MADRLLSNPSPIGVGNSPTTPGQASNNLMFDPTPVGGGQSAGKISAPAKPSDITGDPADDHDGTMYDGKGRVIPPEETVPKTATAAFGAGAGAFAGGAVAGLVPELKAIPGADKGIPAWTTAIGAGIGFSTPFNHAVNRGVNTLLYPRGGFTPPPSQEDDMSAFARE